MSGSIRILLLADTHLGFDLPIRPRVDRRRRGHDFFANYGRALAPALAGKMDLVIHAGDVFHRSRVPKSLVYQAFQPLARIADRSVPVFVVPGNHERSRIPHPRIAHHPGVHVFDRPRSYVAKVRGTPVCLTGFPYQGAGVRGGLSGLLDRAGWKEVRAQVRLLCLHQLIEGARVGPIDYTFRDAPDVLRGRDLPQGFAAVLSGHIHRHQVLDRDLAGRPLVAPVLYPGSIERTSVAEADEAKGTVHLRVRPGAGGGGLEAWRFEPLPTRPMVLRELEARGLTAPALEREVRRILDGVPPDAVLRLRVIAPPDQESGPGLTAARLRDLAPPTMNVDFRIVEQAGSG